VGLITLQGGVPRLEAAATRAGWLRAVTVGGLATAAAALACAVALVALPGATTRRQTAAGHGLASLPVAAQGPVSAALGRDEQAYRVTGLQAINPAQRLRARFSPGGVKVESGGAQVSMTLSAYGYASALRSLGAVTPRVSHNRVGYPHGLLRAWYANGPLGLEQGFDVEAPPSAGSGPLTVSLAVSGNLAARLQAGSLLLRGHGVELRYGGLLATDARGRLLRAWLQPAGGHVLIRVDDRGAAYPLRIDPFIQRAEMTASDGAAGDELGWSVAVSGDTIVVGAQVHKVGPNYGQGAVYVFTMPASGWASATQTAELTAGDGRGGSRLGFSVAVSGDTIVAGAPWHNGRLHAQGAVYVFARPRSGWANATQTAELTASDAAIEDELGWSVGISGDTIVSGPLGHEVGANVGQGAVYVFTKPAAGWANATQTAELTASGGAAGDGLGFSVAIAGDTVVAGARGTEVGSNARRGAAYVFTMPASGWANETRATELTASDGAAGDELGFAVAISGTTIAVGAPNRTVGSNMQQGAAYVFTMPASGWARSLTQSAELTASDGTAEGGLGSSVAVSGDTIVAGAPGRTIVWPGAAYVFTMPVSGWAGSLTQSAELTPSDSALPDHFGRSVAISGNTALAGAPGHNVSSNAGAGVAYVFVAPLPWVVIASPINGGTYTRGQAVAASYACSAPEGASITACAGPVANGAAIDTSTLGGHIFTVNTTDSEGVRASQTVGYAVVPRPAGAPVLAGLSETAKAWREGTAPARITTATDSRKKKLPVGTTFSFTLNESAHVRFVFAEPASGRKVGKACVAPTGRNKHKHRCTRIVIAGTLTFSGHAGNNKVRFEGRISKNKKLKPGSYTLLATATALGKRSATRALQFTITSA